MNLTEREQLTRFLLQLVQTQIAAKDDEAERLIKEACSRQPDANYLLIQRSLLLEQALQTAQTEIARLQREQTNSRGATGGFLSGNSWGNTPTQNTFSPGATNPLASSPMAAAPANPSSWGSGLLGTVATTAAGVVAGSFLFQGIEHLMGGHGNSAGSLSGSNSHGLEPIAPTENLVASNDADTTSNSGDFASLGANDADPDWM